MKAGDVIASKYELVSKVGQGGMGSVWRVAHTSTGREFAIKFLHAAVATSEDSRQRFVQEARASARINHPNIIDIFDVGETDDGTLYLVMELLDGISLGEALRSDPPFSARDLLLILAECCTALSAAHAAGVIHRDIKPPNLFLHRDRGTGFVTAKVLDFGVSKVIAGDDGVSTHTGSLLGSPRYMSPEQAHSAASADARSDVWSLGVVLFEALTGRFPHDGDSSNSLVVAIATRPPKTIESVAPQLPQAIRLLIDDCLKPQAQRVASTDELLDRILAILATHGLTDIPLARPTIAKGKMRVRPESFVVRASPESIPGVATSMMRARALAQSDSIARAIESPQQLAYPQGPRPSALDLSFGNTSTAQTPRLERPTVAPQSEDATLVHMLSEPTTDTYRRPTRPMSTMAMPAHVASTHPFPSFEAHPSEPERGSSELPHPSAAQSHAAQSHAAQSLGAYPQGWRDPRESAGPSVDSAGALNVGRSNAIRRTIRLEESATAGSAQRAWGSSPGIVGRIAAGSEPFRDSLVQAGDPLVESISSINVARSPELAHPFDPTLLEAPAFSAASKTPKLWAILGLVGALAALASAAVIVSYTRGTLGAARSSETGQPTEAIPRAPSHTEPSVATSAATSVAEASPSSAPSSEATVTPASSARPTSVSELPAVGPTAKPGLPPSGRLPPKSPSKPTDPLKNLGSGLGP